MGQGRDSGGLCESINRLIDFVQFGQEWRRRQSGARACPWNASALHLLPARPCLCPPGRLHCRSKAGLGDNTPAAGRIDRRLPLNTSSKPPPTASWVFPSIVKREPQLDHRASSGYSVALTCLGPTRLPAAPSRGPGSRPPSRPGPTGAPAPSSTVKCPVVGTPPHGMPCSGTRPPLRRGEQPLAAAGHAVGGSFQSGLTVAALAFGATGLVALWQEWLHCTPLAVRNPARAGHEQQNGEEHRKQSHHLPPGPAGEPGADPHVLLKGCRRGSTALRPCCKLSLQTPRFHTWVPHQAEQRLSCGPLAPNTDLVLLNAEK